MPAIDRDHELLRHVEAGELHAAGTLLVHGYADEVYALCRAMLRDPVQAEDLSQEVFVRAFGALSGFRKEASVRTWLLRIARNRCIDALRALEREPVADDDEPDGQPAAEPSIADLTVYRQDLRAGLDALTENERALVILRFGHGLGYDELAATFGSEQGAIRMRVSRAVAKMRAALAEVTEQPVPAAAFAAPAPAAMAPATPARARSILPAFLRRRGRAAEEETPREPLGAIAEASRPPAPGAPSRPGASPAAGAVAAAPWLAHPAPEGLRARLLHSLGPGH